MSPTRRVPIQEPRISCVLPHAEDVIKINSMQTREIVFLYLVFLIEHFIFWLKYIAELLIKIDYQICFENSTLAKPYVR